MAPSSPRQTFLFLATSAATPLSALNIVVFHADESLRFVSPLITGAAALEEEGQRGGRVRGSESEGGGGKGSEAFTQGRGINILNA